MMMKLTTMLALGLMIAAAPAHAQTAEAPAAPLDGAPRVVVTDRAGQETTGRLLRWTPSTIVIKTRTAERTYSPGEAVRVDLRDDSLRNGFLIGAAIGSFGGLITDCPGSKGSCPGSRVALTVFSIATWGAIGAGIDALIPGRSPLWRAGP